MTDTRLSSLYRICGARLLLRAPGRWTVWSAIAMAAIALAVTVEVVAAQSGASSPPSVAATREWLLGQRLRVAPVEERQRLKHRNCSLLRNGGGDTEYSRLCFNGFTHLEYLGGLVDDLRFDDVRCTVTFVSTAETFAGWVLAGRLEETVVIDLRRIEAARIEGTALQSQATGVYSFTFTGDPEVLSTRTVAADEFSVQHASLSGTVHIRSSREPWTHPERIRAALSNLSSHCRSPQSHPATEPF